MVPIGTAPIGNLAHSGITGADVLSAVECQLIGYPFGVGIGQ